MDIELRDKCEIPEEYSENYERLNSLSELLIYSTTSASSSSVSEDDDDDDDDEDEDAYVNLAECQSGHTDGEIIQSELVTIKCSMDKRTFVESPRRKMTLATSVSKEAAPVKSQPPNNARLKQFVKSLRNGNDLSIKNWINTLRDDKTGAGGGGRKSLPSTLSNRDFAVSSLSADEDDHDEDEFKTDECYKLNGNCQDERIIELRRQLFSSVNLALRTTILSPLRLNNFRESLIVKLRDKLNDSIEQFVLEMFDFFSVNLFMRLLESVKVEWSYRLKSSAASTILVRNHQSDNHNHHNHNHNHHHRHRQPTSSSSLSSSSSSTSYVCIRLSWNLLNKLNRVELIKILLHEMIHAYLGVAIGDFDEKHDENYKKIQKKIDRILKLNIPIEHDYEETLDLAYIWICNVCKEKRIRFYNIPPTPNQKEEHAIKCHGEFKLVKQPRL